VVHDTISLLRILISRTFHSSSYGFFRLSISCSLSPCSSKYFLSSSILCQSSLFFFYSIFLLFLSCIHSFHFLFSSEIGFCCILRIGSSFISSNFLPFFSSTPYYTSYFPICIATLPYISLIVLY